MITSNVLILIDQFTKFLVTSHIPLHHAIPIIRKFFSLTHIRNPGVAFGLFAHSPSEYKTMLFVMISSVAIAAILYFFHHTPNDRRLAQNGLTLIFSGAIGNLIDRIVHKEVIDFLDFFAGIYHWPAFNVADSFITSGAVVLIVDSLFSRRKTHTNISGSGEPGN